MSALDDLFERCAGENRAALVGYLPAGYPSKAGAIEAMLAMVEAGVDAIEVGAPYSDPLMEGLVIQEAHRVALLNGTRTTDVLDTISAVSATGVPTVVMGYWNPVHRYGFEAWARDLKAAGGAGAITPDLPPEEAPEWLEAAERHGLDPIFLVAPSSTDERIAAVCRANRGFVYAAAVMGVTGARSTVGNRAEELVGRVRQHTDLPVAVGLGVSNAEHVAEIGRYADGVIVGSALVAALGGGGPEAVGSLVRELVEGTRRR